MTRELTPADFNTWDEYVQYVENRDDTEEDMDYTERRMRDAENHGMGDR